MRLPLPVFCLLFCCLFSVQNLLASPQQLSLTLYTEEFPPYSFLHQGKIRGINADILQEACTLAQLKCDMVSLPWLRAFERAQQDSQSGLFPTVRTPKRSALFQWVGPIASAKAYLYRLKSRPQISPQNLNEAKNFGIAVARGDVYEEYLTEQGFKRGVNLLDFATKSEPIPLFLQGKVDLIIGSELVLPDWLAKYGKDLRLVEPVLDISAIGNNFLALNKAVSPGLAHRLQQAINELKHNGRFDAIIRQYNQNPGQFQH